MFSCAGARSLLFRQSGIRRRVIRLILCLSGCTYWHHFTGRVLLSPVSISPEVKHFNMFGIGVPVDILVVTPEDIQELKDKVGSIIGPVLQGC